MPKYAYRCKACEFQFEIRHSMRDRLYNCTECTRPETLVRIPQMVFKQTIDKEAAGVLVREYIEDNKEILKDQKHEASKEYYEP